MKKKMRWIVLIPLVVIVSSLIGIWVLTSNWLESGQNPKADGTNQYAIVLGAKVKKGNIPSFALQYRLEAALAYAQKYTHVKLVLSGGRGPDEDIEEAVVMRDFLLENGITEDRLILEDKATSTYENLLFSQELLPSNIDSVTLITSDYHLQRSKVLASKIGWKSDVVAAKTPKVVELKVRTRERVALLKAYILGN